MYNAKLFPSLSQDSDLRYAYPKVQSINRSYKLKMCCGLGDSHICRDFPMVGNVLGNNEKFRTCMSGTTCKLYPEYFACVFSHGGFFFLFSVEFFN